MEQGPDMRDWDFHALTGSNFEVGLWQASREEHWAGA